jgi:leader peptidase (prepilin peptidase)/N-methyltransferase
MVVVIFMGVVVGWLVNAASDYLPRFAVNHPPTDIPQHFPTVPAIWRIVTAHREGNWFRLHLTVEIISGFVFGFLWQQFELSWTFALLAAGYTFFLLVAVIDLKYRLILNVLTYPAMAVIVLVHVLPGQNALGFILGGVLAFSLFFATAWLKPGDLGGGDVKLAALIGFTFGFPQLLWALIVGAGMGGIASVLLLATKRGNLGSRIPYAPFLCLGAMVALLYNPIVMRV